MRITETKLRQLIREEILAVNEAKTWGAAVGMADDCAVDGCNDYAMEDYNKCEKHWKEDVIQRRAQAKHSADLRDEKNMGMIHRLDYREPRRKK